MTNLVEDIMGIPDIHEAFNAVKEVNKYWKVRWGFSKTRQGKRESTTVTSQDSLARQAVNPQIRH
jgi:hypothetical protein